MSRYYLQMPPNREYGRWLNGPLISISELITWLLIGLIWGSIISWLSPSAFISGLLLVVIMVIVVGFSLRIPSKILDSRTGKK